MPIIAIVLGIIILAGAFGYAFLMQEEDYDIETNTPVVRDETVAPATNPTEEDEDDDDEDRSNGVPATTTTETEAVAPVVETPSEPVVNSPEPVAPPVVIDPEPVVTIPAPAPELEPTTVYEDGTYTAPITYRSPGGNDAMTVTLTIADDVVTAVSTSYGPASDTSENYQDRFDRAYQSQVVGKSVDSISLSRVGGASLTSGGFNNALADIKADAKN